MLALNSLCRIGVGACGDDVITTDYSNFADYSNFLASLAAGAEDASIGGAMAVINNRRRSLRPMGLSAGGRGAGSSGNGGPRRSLPPGGGNGSGSRSEEGLPVEPYSIEVQPISPVPADGLDLANVDSLLQEYLVYEGKASGDNMDISAGKVSHGSD